MIKASAVIVRPEDVTVAVTLQMTVGDARKLIEQQPTEWPSIDLASSLRSALSKLIDRVERNSDDL